MTRTETIERKITMEGKRMIISIGRQCGFGVIVCIMSVIL